MLGFVALFEGLVGETVHNVTIGDAEQISHGQDIGAAFAVSLIPTYLQVPFIYTIPP